MTKKTTLANGIVVITTENPTADIIAGRLFFRAGSCWEPRKQAGLTSLLAAVMMKGTRNLSALEIAEKVESVGASLGTDASTDYFLVFMKSVTKDFLPLLQLAGEIIRSPSFPEEQIELERRLILQQIRQSQEQPMTVAFDTLRQLIYQDHPYATSSLGTIETVTALSKADLQYFHGAYLRPDNLVISIAGNITHPEVLELVEQVLGDWQAPAVPMPEMVWNPLSDRPQSRVIQQQTQQAIVMLGYLAASVYQPAYPALKLLSAYLGNGLSSRLFVEIREKQGLAYEVSALYPTRADISAFVVYLGTAAANQDLAQAGLKAEVDRLSTTLLTNKEVQIIKNKVLGQYALGKQTNAQLAQIYGWYEAINLGIDFDQKFIQRINQVTAADLQAAARQYLQTPYISIVSPNN